AAQNGVATFSSISIDTPGSGYVLAASTPGAAVANSTPFDVVAPPAAPPTHLAFIAEPGTTRVGDPISPAVQVAAEDSTGALAVAFTGTITVALGANPGGGTLHGTQTVSATNGVATFSTLSIDQAGAGYTLSATASNLTGTTSQGFDIDSAPPPTNHPPVVNAGGTQSALEAVLYQLNASFSDVDGDGPWTYAVNWGDGSSSSGSLSAQGAIGPSHTYVLPGAYTITVTVTDSHGASGSDSKTLNVTL
ncbi:MAG TPA: PKD domain-containing protein, partial [Gemmatimonadales bacterium]|nr:PKD domain-containing protein [Gemmatimonadales bacterium]